MLIQCSLYDFYNVICILSMSVWSYIHLDIPVLMLPVVWGGEYQPTGNINTGMSRCIYAHINVLLIVKIIWTTFYQQQPHKYFNLIIFNESLIL